MSDPTAEILELTWHPMPWEEPGVIGRLKGMPELSLFFIAPDETNPSRWRLTGAVISDHTEDRDDLMTGYVEDLKMTAHVMMRSFLVRLIGGVFGGLDRPIAVTDLKVITKKLPGERDSARVAFLVENLMENER